MFILLRRFFLQYLINKNSYTVHKKGIAIYNKRSNVIK